MPERTDTLRAGQYFLGVQGLAMLRSMTTPSAAAARCEESRQIASAFDEFPHSLEIPLVEHDTEVGYTAWAPVYDGPNPAIDGEQPVVHAILESLPVGDALDAACGTGRHAVKLAELGHRVIGVDATQAMLDVAPVEAARRRPAPRPAGGAPAGRRQRRRHHLLPRPHPRP